MSRPKHQLIHKILNFMSLKYSYTRHNARALILLEIMYAHIFIVIGNIYLLDSVSNHLRNFSAFLLWKRYMILEKRKE